MNGHISKALVADIQRFSLHDGPGIRTSVFLKGCNMRCAWCHNPETIHRWPEIMLDPDLCIHCGKCNQGCFSGARKTVGEQMSAAQVMEIVLQDKNYYSNTGGLTLTGGEPTLQPEFSKALLTLAREKGVHCAVETNLATPAQTLLDVVSRCDLIMCDIKIWDSELHLHYTGVDNKLILENLLKIDALGVPIIVRTPLIAQINDQDECMEQIARYIGNLTHLQFYELLPYHPLGCSKTIEGLPPQQRFAAPSKDRLLQLANIAGNYVRQVRIASKVVAEEKK